MAATSSPPRSSPAGGDRNRGPSIIVLNTLLVTVGTILMLARLYVRFLIVKNPGLDDLFVGLGLICAIATLVPVALMVHYGLGRHVFYLELSAQPLSQTSQVRKWLFVGQLFLIISTMFARVSICLFLVRIFGTNRSSKWILYSIMVFVVASSIFSVSISSVQCSPVQKYFNPLISGTCWSVSARSSTGYFIGAVSIVCDWILASLPVLFMWKLQMSLRLKVGVCVLMGMGFFSGICALVRTVLLKVVFETDVTWSLVPDVIWAILEQNIGIIAACIPTLKPLFDTSINSPWSARSWGRELAHERPAQPYDEHDDRRRLQSGRHHNIHLDILSATRDEYLGDDRMQRNRIEIEGGGHGRRSARAMGLGRDEIMMETEFGAHKIDMKSSSDRV